MTAAEASNYLSLYAFSKEQLENLTEKDVTDYLARKNIPETNVRGMDIDQMKVYLSQNNWFVREVQSFANMPMHLGLNWKDTLKFQNEAYDKDNPGKFDQFLALEQEFARDPDCKSIEVLGGCKALTEYQKLKTNDVTGTATIVYDAKNKDQAIQITKYIDWIKANYNLSPSTALIFKADKGVEAK